MEEQVKHIRFLFLLSLLLFIMLASVPGAAFAQQTTVDPAAFAASCTGSLAPRLVVGGQGQIAAAFSTLRDAPFGNPMNILYAPATFTVLEGPRCAGGLAYFRIDYGNGRVGWALESERYSAWGNDRYWLAPVSAPPPPTPTAVPAQPAPADCSGSLPSRLVVGRAGVITERYSTLRDAPYGNPINIIYAPATFTVLEGPRCAGGFAYFRIDYGNGRVGWALESERNSIWGNDKYWLAPAGGPAS